MKTRENLEINFNPRREGYFDLPINGIIFINLNNSTEPIWKPNHVARLTNYQRCLGGAAYLRDEPEVVTDEQHATLEVVYGLSEGVDRLHVEMVRGFVQ